MYQRNIAQALAMQRMLHLTPDIVSPEAIQAELDWGKRFAIPFAVLFETETDFRQRVMDKDIGGVVARLTDFAASFAKRVETDATLRACVEADDLAKIIVHLNGVASNEAVN